MNDEPGLDDLINRLNAAQPHPKVDPVMQLSRARLAEISDAEFDGMPFAEPGQTSCGSYGLLMIPLGARAASVAVPEMIRCALLPGHDGVHSSPAHPNHARGNWTIRTWPDSPSSVRGATGHGPVAMTGARHVDQMSVARMVALERSATLRTQQRRALIGIGGVPVIAAALVGVWTGNFAAAMATFLGTVVTISLAAISLAVWRARAGAPKN